MTNSGIFGTRPRVRHDIVFAETYGGVLFRHAEDGFVLKGKSAYPLVSALLPHLDGGRYLEELCEGLPAPQREMVAQVVQTLLDRGYARDAKDVPPADLPEGFETQIRFIEHFVDGAAARFSDFRNAKVAVYGAGELAKAVSLGLVTNGLSSVHLVAEPTADLPAERIPHQVVDPGELVPNDYDVIVVDADQVGVEAVTHLTRCLSGQSILLPVVTMAGRAILGPAVRAGAAPCWTCALLRVSANLDPVAVADSWRCLSLQHVPRQRTRASLPIQRMLGNALAFDAFRLLTGCLPAETQAAVLVVDLELGESRREDLRTHPLCPECVDAEEIAATPPTWDHTPEADIPYRDLHQRYERLVAPHVGVLSGFDDDSVSQAPVKTGRVRLGPPNDLAAGQREFTGFDLSTTFGARNRAVEKAALAYVEQLGDRGLAHRVSLAEARNRGRKPVPVQSLATWSGVQVAERQPMGWRYARSLATGELVEIPAAAVFPADEPGALVEPTGAGLGAGPTLSLALQRGLHSAIAHHALRNLISGGRAWTLDPASAGDPEIDMLSRAVAHLGHELHLVGLPADGLSSVVLAYLAGSSRWTVSSALTSAEAIKTALVELVGLIRTPDETAAVLDDLDPELLCRARGLPSDLPLPDSDQDLVRRLAATGWGAYVVDTTTPDLRQVLSTVRVVLSTSGRGTEPEGR